MPPSLLRSAAAARAAYQEGDRLATAGENAAAADAYRRALRARPGFAEAWNNLGNVLMAERRCDEAAECYRAALAHGLDHPLVRYNLATALRRLGDLATAESLFHHALAMRPDYAEAWNNLANLLREDKRLPDSCVGYFRALRLAPDWEDAHDNLSGALYLLAEAGDMERARVLALRWRAAFPGHPLARHLGAALAGEAGETRASDGYVRQVFDAFAADFDEKLAELQYRAPELLAQALSRAGVAVTDGGALDVLDAGCGTGLCGPLLRGGARRLDGVDLSPEMLARAAARGLYDALHAEELTAFLSARPGEYDVIVAADVLCYFGALTEPLAAAAAALRPGGALAFSVERRSQPLAEAPTDGAPTDGAKADYVLQAHGRYAHDEKGVRKALAAAGFGGMIIERAALRTESGRPVEGLTVVAFTATAS